MVFGEQRINSELYNINTPPHRCTESYDVTLERSIREYSMCNSWVFASFSKKTGKSSPETKLKELHSQKKYIETAEESFEWQP